MLLVVLVLKDPGLEASRVLREVAYRKCYVGWCRISEFVSYLARKRRICESKEFSDFVHVMEAFNIMYSAVNFLKMVRNCYVRRGVLVRMSTFERVRRISEFEDKERAAMWIQLKYREFR
jgi:hypothetical protein